MHTTNHTFTTDSSRWQALQTRDKSAHSLFVYAVVTTRIVCRPTCPSRLARRSNIVYYDTVLEALLDGFRSCKRCKPDLPDELDHDAAAEMVIKAFKVIDSAEGRIKAGEVADVIGVSSRHLFGLFRGKLGCSPAGYAAYVRRMGERGLMMRDGVVGVRGIWACNERKSGGLCDSSGDPQVPPDGDTDICLQDFSDVMFAAFDFSGNRELTHSTGRTWPRQIHSQNVVIEAT